MAAILKRNGVALNRLSADAWFIGSDAEQRLKEKIERIGKPLKNWDVNIYRGILTGLNEAFIIDSDKRQEILDKCLTKTNDAAPKPSSNPFPAAATLNGITTNGPDCG